MISFCIFATLAVLARGQGAGMMPGLLSSMMMGNRGTGGNRPMGGNRGMGGMTGGFRHPSSFTGMSLEGLCNFYSLQARGDTGVLSDMMGQGVKRLVTNPAMLMMNPSLAGSRQYQCLAKVYGRMSPSEFAGTMSDLADGAGCYNFFCFDGPSPGVIADLPENAARLNWFRMQNRMQGITRARAAAAGSTSLGSLIANAMGGGAAGGLAGNGRRPGAGMGGAFNGMGGATNGMGGATNGMGGATNGMGGARNGMGGATNPRGGLPSGMSAITAILNGATSGLGGPTNGMGGATNGMGGATNGMGGVTPRVGGATNGMGGVSTGMGTSFGTATGLPGSTGMSTLPGMLANPMTGTPSTSSGSQVTGGGSTATTMTSNSSPGAGGSQVNQLLQRLQSQYDPARLQRLLTAILSNPMMKMMF